MGGLSRRSVSIALALMLPGVALAQNSMPMSAPQNATPATGPRVALKGYDPVSYFTDGKPEQGSAEFSFAFDDTTYWFKSAEHRDKFAADPEHYAPQFDGFCAIQLSRGLKVEADPEAWVITNGKLYVFSKKGGPAFFNKEPLAIAEKASKTFKQLRTQ